MSELRYPNESKAYRDARDALLKDEKELADKTKAVAAKRRQLPDGGQLKEDYVFQWANDGKVGQRVKFSELFGGKNSLLLYSFMYGPNWDKPCPSCTSLMDGLTGPGTRSVRTLLSPRLPRRRPRRSTSGPRSVAGRRFRCCQVTSRRSRPTTSARIPRKTTCNGR
jgi:hypothetical protein